MLKTNFAVKGQEDNSSAANALRREFEKQIERTGAKGSFMCFKLADRDDIFAASAIK